MATANLLLVIFLLSGVYAVTDLLERVPGMKYLALDYTALTDAASQDCENRKTYDKENRATYVYQIHRNRAREQLGTFKMYLPRDVPHMSGNYSFEDLNINQYMHHHFSKMIPGRAKLNLEFYTAKGAVLCFQGLATLKPLGKPKKTTG